MALNNGVRTDAYSGRPAYYLRLYVWRSAVSGNSARYSWWLRAYNPNRSKLTYTLGDRPWEVNVEGDSWSGLHDIDFRGGQEYIQFASGTTGWKAHSATGYLTVNYSASHTTPSVFGSAALSGSFASDRIPKAPGKTRTPVLGTVGATNIAYTIYQPSDNGGSAVTTYNHQVSTSPTFATIAKSWNSGSTSQNATDLNPGTKYYIRYRAVNKVGVGPWSDAASATTLTTTAPGIVVIPNPSGASATVGLTPPPGSGVPTGYRIQLRPTGGAASTIETTVTPYNVSPLIPGQSYDWRAAAKYGTFVGPYSGWTTVVQPQPSVDLGAYFDGSYPARTDVSFSWEGTAHASKSIASAFVPRGWSKFMPGTSGGAGIVTRVTGGRSGSFAALAQVTKSATAAGAYFGVGNPLSGGTIEGAFPVLAGAAYGGLIHVNPSRTQRIVPRFQFFGSTGNELGFQLGEPVILAANTWTAVRFPQVTIPGAVGEITYAGLYIQDVEGSGWAPWAVGDKILLDDAIAPFSDYYFDGSTPDTARYNYVWTGTANASASQRTINTAAPVDPLVDPDCPPVPAPPRPPAIADSCVEDDVTTWRQFWTEIDWASVPEWYDAVPVVQVRTEAPVRLVRIRYYQNPFRQTLDQIPSDSYCNEQIISYIPGDTLLTLDGVSTRVWAEVSGSPDSLAADHLLYRGLTDVPVWPLLGCGSGYYITVDVPGETPQGSISVDYKMVPRYT